MARILEKAKKMNITYSDIKDADPDDVIEKFYSTRLSKSSNPLPDFEKIYQRLYAKNQDAIYCIFGESTGMNILMDLNTQFSANYHHWEKDKRIKVVMVMNRVPDEKMYIDWFEDNLNCVKNKEGEIL